MAKVKTELSKSEIEAKKDELKAKISESKKKALVGRSSPAKDFLNEISDIVKDALKYNVSYKQLTKDILEIYNFKVSEQTIRAFAHNTLGIKKKTRAKTTIKNEAVTEAVTTAKDEELTSSQLKEQPTVNNVAKGRETL